jgi:hypothetical protein
VPGDFKIQISGDASSLVSESGKAGQALDDVGKKVEKAGKKTKEHGDLLHQFQKRGEESRRTLQELAGTVPGLEQVLQMVFNPTTGIISFGIIGYQFLKKAIDDSNAALDEQMKKNADPSFLAAMTAKKEAIENAAIALDLWRDKLEHAADSIDHVAEAQTAATAIANAAFSAQRSAGDALFGLDVAKLKFQYETGATLFEDYQARLLAAEIKRLKDTEAAEEAHRAKLLKDKEAELAAYQGAAPGEQAAAEAARGKATAEAAKVISDKGTLEALKKDLEEQKQREAELQDKGDTLYDPKTGGNVFTRMPQDQADYDAAQAAITGDLSKIGRLKNALPGEEKNAGIDDQRASRLESVLERHTAAMETLAQAITTQRSEDAYTNSGARTALHAHIETAILNNPVTMELAVATGSAIETIVKTMLNIADRLNNPIHGRGFSQ